ncbi:MAG TPA: hypothetical protein VGL86_31830, partial [Polyangia bacterium]
MIEARFSYEALMAAADRASVVRELEDELTRRLRGAANPVQEASRIIEELRRLGHDLWSFDDRGDVQLWCGDWVH